MQQTLVLSLLPRVDQVDIYYIYIYITLNLGTTHLQLFRYDHVSGEGERCRGVAALYRSNYSDL